MYLFSLVWSIYYSFAKLVLVLIYFKKTSLNCSDNSDNWIVVTFFLLIWVQMQINLLLFIIKNLIIY